MSLFEEIYNNMTGLYKAEYAMESVENAFQAGQFCMKEYEEMREHYEWVCKRLGLEEYEDPDLDMIVYHMEQIQKELCRRMFRYGMAIAMKE